MKITDIRFLRLRWGGVIVTDVYMVVSSLQAAKKYHPDVQSAGRSGDKLPGADCGPGTVEFSEINEAYAVLMDTAKRRLVNRTMSNEKPVYQRPKKPFHSRGR